ncbi:DUF1906 domain-containing protein [Desmonostoc muscorum LEGE 12446]|uniref:DUF1906 domain-containing protein n=1 Tax=Desmonostoc muscorum LEGE 12446 TaxID=1828758 RepID=A0A8J7AD69_DESMC|nr:glycoside hydrolase domain-containing protein [Desmonostoc muscorum]MCF2151904.1 DUF1906 domain-containing protein [Desmonostoc muscorum LEGE 12446]
MSGHAGFDRLQYPGDSVMQWLRDNTNLAWIGFYLAPAPSQPYTGWMLKHDFLKNLGWGFAPIYVGQQAQGPGSRILTAQQGRIDAQDATNLASNAGFPQFSVLYLDVEQGPPLDQSVIDYYTAWVQVVFDNNYYPGVYCSHLLADQFIAADNRVLLWVFNLRTYSSNQFYPNPYPNPDPSIGHPSSTVWQLAQNCLIDAGSIRINPIDLDSSSLIDPSVFISP